MRLSPTIIEALEHPALFKGQFDAPSWDTWKVFLRALYGLPMDDKDLAIFRHHTHRTKAPDRPSRYAEIVAGRRGGKSRILALLATYLGCVIDHTPYLVPGENAVIAIIAKDRDQAKVIKNYIVGFMRSIPIFADLIEDELAESVRLTNHVVVEVHTASIGAPRGRTFLAVLCDEASFWNSTAESANPDVEVINAVRPGLSTIPYSLLLIASSPYAKRGVLYQNYAKYFGKDDAPVLVFQGSTEEFNSTQIGESLIAEMYAEDPERASAEFGGIFRSDIVQFITREAVEDCIPRGVRELPPGGGIVYSAACDPSGGSADSMTLAIVHVEQDGIAIVDAVREVKPPFSPDTVVQEFAALLKSYGISRVVGDAYAGEWPRERFSVHGITYEVSKKNKSSAYLEFLPALNARRVRLLDLPRLIGQLCGLERRTARGGRDSIDHEQGASSHDDVANSVCLALVHAIADRRPGLARAADMLNADGLPVPLPAKCDRVFAVLTADPMGTAAVVYAALGRETGALAVTILDFDVVQLHGPLFGAVALRVRDLMQTCGARYWGGDIVCPEALTRLAGPITGGLVKAIPADVVAADLLLAAAGHVNAGRVKICDIAHAKAETSPFGGAINMRIGDTGENPLRDALVFAISLSLQ